MGKILVAILYVCIGWLYGAEKGFISQLSTVQTGENIHGHPLHFDLGEIRHDPKREWTILVYMDGDNDLEKFAIEDINEMELGIGASVEVIVLVDRAEKYDTSNNDWKDTRIYRIRRDMDKQKIHSDLLASPGELNLGDGKVLQEFVRASLEAFPAKHYGLIMWDHGGGWSSHALDINAPGNAQGRDYLTLPELSSAIKNALTMAGLKRFDIIGFDMCLMAQLETATQLQGLGTVMVASEAIEPDQGWPYEKVLPEFSQGTRGSRRIAAEIVQHYAKFYRDIGRPYTMSALDLDMTDTVLSALNHLIDAFDLQMDQLWALISRTLFYAEAYTDRTKETKQQKNAIASMDLVDALKRIHFNAPEQYNAQKAYETFIAVLDRFILAEERGKVHRLSNGLSVYAPTNKINFNEAYLKTRFAKESHWIKFLENLYAHQRGQAKPVIKDMKLIDYAHNQIHEAQSAVPLSTQGVLYTLNGKNILWLNGMTGFRSEDGKSVLVLNRSTALDTDIHQRSRRKAAGKKNYALPQYRDGSNQRIIQYSGHHYAVTDGKKAYRATMIMPLHEDAIVVSVRYDHPETGDLFGQIFFDTKLWKAEELYVEIPQKNAPALYRQIQPKKDAKITLLFEKITTDGNVSYEKGDTFVWGDGPDLVLALDQPNNYTIGLKAKVIGGNSKIKFYDFKVTESKELKEMIAKGSKYTEDDLIGTWDYIDTKAFNKLGKVVPLGLNITFKHNPKSQAFLLAETQSAKTPNKHSKALALLDLRMLPHTRLFSFEKNGRDADGSTLSLYITLVFKTATGKYIMVQREMLGGRIYTAIKRNASAANNAINKPVKQASPSIPYTKLSGIWYTNGGEILSIQNQYYTISEAGREVDRGTYRIQQNLVITTSTYTGIVTKFVFTLQGNTLYLKDGFGNQYRYTRAPS